MLSEAESALSFLVETHPRAESALSFLIEKYHILRPLSTFWWNISIFLDHFLLFDRKISYSWITFYFLMEKYHILRPLSTFWWKNIIFLHHFLLFDEILAYSWTTFYFLIEKYHILAPLSAFYSKNTQFQTKQQKKSAFSFFSFKKNLSIPLRFLRYVEYWKPH